MKAFLLILCQGLGLALFAYSPFVDCARADVRVCIVDQDGGPVPDANVSLVFFTAPSRSEVYKGVSDHTGSFSAAGACNGELSVVVRKDGFFTTRRKVAFRTCTDADIEKTRAWSNGTVESRILLKRIREPVRAVRHWDPVKRTMDYPATNVVMGFDVEMNAWCAPYGKGAHDDFQFRYEAGEGTGGSETCFARLTVSMTNRLDGFYFARLDTESFFKYPEQAMANANYQKTLCWEYRRERGKAVVAHDPPLDKCLVFRTRTKVDDKGELVSAHYGYLGEKVSFETGLGILSVFNPTANDVRLEDCGAVEDFLRRERIRRKIRE